MIHNARTPWYKKVEKLLGGFASSLLPKGKKVSPAQFRFTLIAFLSALMWSWQSDRANALIPFQDAATAVATEAGAFMAGIGILAGTAPYDALTAFINFIPWMILLISVAAIAWQCWNAYQEYQRDNQSGMIQPMLSILVLVFFLIFGDTLSRFITAP
ncbi:hypothetical protein [Chamaesiphon sp.]|uniref:hypothetical protein n=1 Tax=Chamaesiphon sp. TaxID=2814140 RepID=UPI0035932D3B